MSDDISTTPGAAAAAPRGLAIASLVTGLLGLVLVGVFFWTPAGPTFLWIGAVLGLAGLILGVVAMRKGQTKAMAVVGLIAGILALLGALATFIFAMLFIGAFTLR